MVYEKPFMAEDDPDTDSPETEETEETEKTEEGTGEDGGETTDEEI